MLIEAEGLLGRRTEIRHAFFTREGGASRGIYGSLNGGLGSADDPENVASNRARMAERMGVSTNEFVSLHQIHSAEAVLVEVPWHPSARPRADAMATATPGIALAITTADCGPVLFADTRAGVIGAAHAGWKGALGGVLDATVDRMEELGATRGDIVAVLGPTISRPSYEVGPDLLARFTDDDPLNARFFHPAERPDRRFFDLPAFIVSRLEATGIGECAALGRCTYAEPDRFFSYRRATHRGEPDYGRQISAICLAG